MTSQELAASVELLKDRLDRRLVRRWEAGRFADELLSHLRRRSAPKLPFSPERLGRIAQLAREHDPAEADWERRIAEEGVAGRLYAASNPYCDRFAQIDRSTFNFTRFEHEDPEALHGLNRLRTLASLGRIYWEEQDPRYFNALMDWWDFYDRVVPDPTEAQMAGIHAIGPVGMAPPYAELDGFIRLMNFWWAFWLSLFAESMTGDRCCVLLARCLRLFDLVAGRGVKRHEHNFTSMQYEAVYHWAMALPEIPAMTPWKHAARNILESSLDRAVFEDGVQWEKSVSYHIGCIRWYGASCHLGRLNGEPFAPAYEERLRKMGHYADALVTPDGMSVPQSDSDRTRGWESGLALLRGLFPEERFTHEVRPTYWSLWITDGTLWPSGQAVSPPPVRVFERAGVAVARHPDGNQMLVLDNGPTAAGHSHRANLTIHYEALGRPVIVDPGRWIYGQTPARRWAVSPEAHNTVVIEDQPCRAEEGTGIDRPSFYQIALPGDPRLGEIVHESADGVVRIESQFSGFVDDSRARVTRRLWMPVGPDQPFLVVCDRMEGSAPHQWTSSWLWPAEAPMRPADGGFRLALSTGPQVALAAWDSGGALRMRDDPMFWSPNYAEKTPARWTRWSTRGERVWRCFVLAVGSTPASMPAIQLREAALEIRVWDRHMALEL